MIVEKPATHPSQKECFVFLLILSGEKTCLPGLSNWQFQGDYPVSEKLSLPLLSEVIST